MKNHPSSMRIGIRLLALVFPFLFTLSASAGTITADGQRLATSLDAMNVESHWPAGIHVNWETGIPDGKPEESAGKHTHCSAFVAAAAMNLGIYILRPPDHGQILLANAQYDWLETEGAKNGWRALRDGQEAQQDANRGMLVVASYKNKHDDKPGHIVIVRPSDKTSSEILSEGPQVTQAGTINHRSIDLKEGFAGHPSAWKNNEVRYYAHAVDWSKLKKNIPAKKISSSSH